MIASKRGSFVAAVTAVCAVFLCIAAADGAWLKDVPDADRQRVNPFAGQKDAILAGNRIFVDHCAKCHGDDGTGRKKKAEFANGSRAEGDPMAKFFGF